MINLAAGCVIEFETQGETPFVLMLRPRRGEGQDVVTSAITTAPGALYREYQDRFGNLCQRIIAPAGRFTITASVLATVASTLDIAPGAPTTRIPDLPDDVLHFLLPSRYAQSDQIGDLALDIAKDFAPGYDQVEAIRAWIHANVEYRYGHSDASTSALDTARDRIGVCRDYVHLAMALTRSLCIPARMVVGYLHELKPMDQHAWFEAFIDGRWYGFDATQTEPKGGRIVVAYGRDAADVALTTQYGPAALTNFHAWVEER